jgi:hypothetical protein
MIDIIKKHILNNQKNILYTYPGLTPPNYPFNVKTALDYFQGWVDDVGYTGRTSPDEVITLDGTSNVTIQAGVGYISDGNSTTRVYWDSTTFYNIGFLDQEFIISLLIVMD